MAPAKQKDGEENNEAKQRLGLDSHPQLKGRLTTLHDLRRTFAIILASIGTPLRIIERLLNHVSGTISGVAAIYVVGSISMRCVVPPGGTHSI